MVEIVLDGVTYIQIPPMGATVDPRPPIRIEATWIFQGLASSRSFNYSAGGRSSCLDQYRRNTWHGESRHSRTSRCRYAENKKLVISDDLVFFQSLTSTGSVHAIEMHSFKLKGQIEKVIYIRPSDGGGGGFCKFFQAAITRQNSVERKKVLPP